MTIIATPRTVLRGVAYFSVWQRLTVTARPLVIGVLSACCRACVRGVARQLLAVLVSVLLYVLPGDGCRIGSSRCPQRVGITAQHGGELSHRFGFLAGEQVAIGIHRSVMVECLITACTALGRALVIASHAPQVWRRLWKSRCSPSRDLPPPENESSVCVTLWALGALGRRHGAWAGRGSQRSRSSASFVNRSRRATRRTLTPPVTFPGRRSRSYSGFGQSRCLCRKSNVPLPWIVCGPTNHSISQRSPIPSFAAYRNRTLANS